MIDSTTKNLATEEIAVNGMHCAGCARKVENAVSSMAGVHDVAVNFTNGRVRVSFDGRLQNLTRIKERVESTGFQVKHEHRQAERESQEPFWRSPEIIAVGLSGILLGLGLLLHFFGQNIALTPGRWSVPLAVPVLLAALVAGAWHFAPQGLRAVRTFTLDINFLMTFAIIGAVLIGEYTEAASLAFLYSLAELLEGYAVERARNSLKLLTQLAPEQAIVKRNGNEIKIDVHAAGIGETLIARPGERIALDGVVISGQSTVNQSPITGESIPIDKTPGDEVYAGSINEQGYLEIRITKGAKDTTLSRVIEMVEEAESQRAPSAKFIDRFARYYTPVIVALAGVIATVPPLVFGENFTLWFEKALTLLVIACPCALVISTPVAVISAITSAARNGVLIKGGIHLENMACVRAIAFDKTGTLTRGQLAVTDVIPLNGMSRTELLRLAASIEQCSEHPIAQAVVHAAGKMAFAPVSEFKITSGQGVQARLEGREYRVGAPRYFNDDARQFPSEELKSLQSSGKTVMLVGDEREILGLIAVADRLRANTPPAISALKAMNVNVSMLSGDNYGTADAIAAEAGISELGAELLPEAKVQSIKNLQARFGKVAMVGDGINDAPALAVAEVGIAMGAAGNDAALETADIALMGDDLSKLPYLVSLSRRARAVIKQNIWIALVLKLGLGAAVFPGWTTLVLAVLIGDMGASLAVIGNALRLARFQPEKKKF